MTETRETRWKAAALLLGTLVLGVLLGAAVVAFAVPLRERRMHGPGGPGGPGGPRVEQLFARELGLSPAQRDSVRAIFERNRPAMDSLWRDVRPRFHSLEQRVQSQIGAQLTPDQRRKFAEMTERMERRERAGHRPGPPPPMDFR